MAKYDKFNRGKYEDAFDQMFGAGRFEQGMQSAREQGRLKAEVSLARKAYQERIKAEEAARKKAEKEKAKKAATALPKADDNYSRKPEKKSSSKKDDGILSKLLSGAKTVGREVSRFDKNIGNALTGGLTGEMDKRLQKKFDKKGINKDVTGYLKPREDGNIAGKGADVLANLVGYGIGGVGATQVMRGLGLTGKAAQTLSKAHKAGTVTKPVLAKGIASSIGEGAAVGGSLAAAESGVRLGLNKESDTTLKKELGSIGTGILLGGALDGLATGLAPAAKMFARDTIAKEAGQRAAAGLKRAETNPIAAADLVRDQMRNSVTTDGILNRTSTDRLFDSLIKQTSPTVKRNPLADLRISPEAQQARSIMEDISINAGRKPKGVNAEENLRNLINARRAETIRDGQLPVNPKVDASDSLQQLANREVRETVGTPFKDNVPPTRVAGNGTPPVSQEVDINRSFIDREVKKPKADTRSAVTKVQQAITNDLAPMRRIDEQMQKLDADGLLEYLNPKTWIKSRKKDAAVNSSLEKSLTNAKGAHSVAANHTTSRWSNFLEGLNKSKATTMAEVEDYAFAKRGMDILENEANKRAARDAMMEEIESLKAAGANSDEIRAMQKIVDDYTDYTMPEGATADVLQAQIAKFEQNPELVGQYKKFQELQQENLKDMYDGGMITRELYDTLKENKTYISMHRNFDDISSTTGMASRRPQNTLQRMGAGSEERIKSPVQEAIRNAYMTKFNIEKNNALKVVEKFAAIDKDNVLFKGVKEPNANTITVFNNGKPKHYEVPPELKSYVDNFNPNYDPNILAKTLQGMAQMQRKLTTQYNIAFQLKSLVREPVQAMMTSRTAPTAIHATKNTALGYLDAMMGETLQEITKGLPKHLQFNSYKANWDKMGGTGFQFIRMTDDDLQRVAKEMLEGGTAKGSIKKLNPFRAIGKFGEKVEEGARLGEFRSAKNQGYSDADAFFEATDVTNYKRTGETTRSLNRYVPFLNATIQGNARVARAFQEAPARTIVRGATMLSTTAVGAYAMRFHDGVSDEQRRELDNLSQWEKDAYMHVPVPNSETIIAIPKAFAVGQMFMNPVERALDDYYNAVLKDKSVPQQVKDGLVATAKSFIPPYEFAIYSTGLEVMTNKSFFTGQDIESEFDRSQGVPKEEIEAYNQSWLTKNIANWINKMSFDADSEGIVSPAQIDYIVKDLTGTGGSQALGIMDSLVSDNAPTKTLEDHLLKPINQFKQDPTRASGVYQELKALAQKEKRNNNSMTKMSEEEKNIERANRPLQNYEAAFKELNKAIQAVRSDKTLSSQEKKEKITELRRQQDALGTQAIDWYNSLK